LGFASIDSLQVKHSEVCSTGYHLAPPVSPSPVEESKSLLSPHVNEDTDAISISVPDIPEKLNSPPDYCENVKDNNKKASIKSSDNETRLKIEENIKSLISKNEDCDSDNDNEETEDCEDIESSSKINEAEAIVGDTNSADSSLWMRTEALLGSQSFNLVRRRLSTSESTN
jgi:hypothetical protein